MEKPLISPDKAPPLTDIIFFVEDPGAANYIAHLPEKFTDPKWHTIILSDGIATKYLQDREIPCQPVSTSWKPIDIITTYRPKVLAVGSSENLDSVGLALTLEAKKQNIKTLGFIDSYMNADFRFKGRSNNPLTYAPDWIVVPDKRSQETFITMGHSPKKVLACGHPHYDYLEQTKKQLAKTGQQNLRKKHFPEAKPHQKIVLLAAEDDICLNPQLLHYSPGFTLSGRGGSTRRMDIVIEEFLDSIQKISPRPYLVLRLHPKNTLEEFESYIGEFDMISAGGSPMELVYAANLVAGITSMLLFEAAFFEKTTLSIIPQPQEKEWLLTVKEGITHCATTREEIFNKLQSLLSDRKPITAKKLSSLLPTHSSHCVINLLENLISQKSDDN